VALNLWKIGGKPTSYNPLPNGSVYVINNEIGKYNFKVKAYSPSGGRLNVFGDNSGFSRTDNLGNVTLTGISKEYLFEVTLTSKQSIYLSNQDNKSDIIIDSIELVQKPLPKLTLNGVDGFTSGKWGLHANAVVIDDETLVLNATSVNQASSYSVNLIGGQTYTMSHGRDNINLVMTIYKDNYIAGTTTISSFVTFVAPTTGSYVIFLTNVNNTLGTLTFKRPMLSLGNTPAPYSRKTGDKMVMPNVKSKNLINGILSGSIVSSVNGTINDSPNAWRTNYIPIDWNKNYYLSGLSGVSSSFLALYDINKNYLGRTGGTPRNSLSFSKDYNYTTAISGTPFYVVITQYGLLDTNAMLNDVALNNNTLQLEEGTSATEFSPYGVQMNKKAKRYVPKKNLVSNAQSDWEVGSGSATVATADSTRIRTKNDMKVMIGTPYTCSFNSQLHDLFIFDVNDARNVSNGLGWFTSSPVTITSAYGNIRPIIRRKDVNFMSVSAIDSINLQIEQGSAATSYEPYTQVMPKARAGLAFNGVSDYLYFTNQQIDEVEYEFTPNVVNSLQAHIHTKDNLGGNLNGYVDVSGRPYIFTTNTDESRTNITSSVSLLRGLRTKIKYSVVNGRRIFINGSEVAFDNKQSKPIYLGAFGIGGGGYYNGVLHKITGYLNGQVVAQYDFENASNIVGNTVFQSGNNLIPNFEDTRWNLHANTQVLGKHLLRLNATAGNQVSSVTLSVSKNTNYLITCNLNLGRIGVYGSDNSYLFTQTSIVPKTFNTGNYDTIMIRLDNSSSNATGTFEFSKPQLYALIGTEGTLYGTPTSARKQSRRTQYAKR
jgi:hypothetical protein